MLRSIPILLIAALTLSVGCSDDSSSPATTAVEQTEDGGGIEVNRGLLSVEITIPASLAGEGDLDEFIAEFAAEGIDVSDARRNPDGSVTYKMSRGDHGRLLTSLRNSFTEGFKESSEEFESVQSISSNNDLTKFEITVDREAFENSFDGFVSFVPLFAAGIYAAFDGRDPEGMRVEINYVDSATGQVFETVVAPDDFED